MSDRFVFHPHPSLATVENVLLNTQRGFAATVEIATQFASLSDVIRHTQAVGSSSIVHVPNGDNFAFVNVPKGELAAAAYQIGTTHGLNTN